MISSDRRQGLQDADLPQIVRMIESLLRGARSIEDESKRAGENNFMWLWRGKAIGYETVLPRLRALAALSPALRPTPPDRTRKLEAMIVRLRTALDFCAHPEEGWPEIECADAYEASRRLVPDVEPDAAIQPTPSATPPQEVIQRCIDAVRHELYPDEQKLTRYGEVRQQTLHFIINVLADELVQETSKEMGYTKIGESMGLSENLRVLPKEK